MMKMWFVLAVTAAVGCKTLDNNGAGTTPSNQAGAPAGPATKLGCLRRDQVANTPPAETPDKIMPTLPEELAAGLRDARTPDERAGFAADAMTVASCDGEQHLSAGTAADPAKWLASASLFFPGDCSCEGYTCSFTLSDAEQQTVDPSHVEIVKSLTSGRVGVAKIGLVCASI